MCDMMEDEVCEMSNDSLRVKERTTFPCQTGWVTFDEPDKESRVIECPAEEKPSEENGRYLSLLEKELQRLQEKKRKPLSSKDIIRTLQEAKEGHMKELMDNSEPTGSFVIVESEVNGNSCCFPMYRALFPKQPLNNEELECLVKDGDQQNR